ncbi:hypothetical protein [Burkholderia territorii]|nr:hypothetical protein [Burkholderia territorii]
MKKTAAAAADLRLAETGWLPEVLTNRETPAIWERGGDDENSEEDAAE